MEPQNEEQKLSIPTAIVVAGILIAVAVLYSGGKKSGGVVAVNNQDDIVTAQKKQQENLADNLLPVTAKDHLLGNPDAPVKIVEFSDLECPFCKRFHPVLKQVMEEYGKDGRVALVYRHFPLTIHPNALPEAVASECVASQLGNIAFWDFIDKFFEASLTNGRTELSVARDIAGNLGANLTKYDMCISDKSFDSAVGEDITDGTNSGVSGTPYSIVIAKNGKKFIVNGALPYESVKATIETALAEGK